MALTWIKNEDLKRAVENSRWLVGNDYEISKIVKVLNTSIQILVDQNISVITTLGEEGVLYQDKVQQIKIPAFRLKKIVDPTGAGDAWRGGFIGGVIEDKDTRFCLKQANALASFAIAYYGTVNHRPTYQEILDRINKI